MDPVLITSLVVGLVKLVSEMSTNWNNPEYTPPSTEQLEEMAKLLESLPNLPTGTPPEG